MGFVVMVVVVVVAVLSSPLSLTFYYYYQYYYCDVWYLCYHYSLLLYRVLSFSLWFFFSLCYNQSKHNTTAIISSCLFYTREKARQRLIEKDRERERECVRFFYIQTQEGFAFFAFLLLMTFRSRFRVFRPFRKKFYRKASVLYNFTKVTPPFQPQVFILCYALLLFSFLFFSFIIFFLVKIKFLFIIESCIYFFSFFWLKKNEG